MPACAATMLGQYLRRRPRRHVLGDNPDCVAAHVVARQFAPAVAVSAWRTRAAGTNTAFTPPAVPRERRNLHPPGTSTGLHQSRQVHAIIQHERLGRSRIRQRTSARSSYWPRSRSHTPRLRGTPSTPSISPQSYPGQRGPVQERYLWREDARLGIVGHGLGQFCGPFRFRLCVAVQEDRTSPHAAEAPVLQERRSPVTADPNTVRPPGHSASAAPLNRRRWRHRPQSPRSRRTFARPAHRARPATVAPRCSWESIAEKNGRADGVNASSAVDGLASKPSGTRRNPSRIRGQSGGDTTRCSSTSFSSDSRFAASVSIPCAPLYHQSTARYPALANRSTSSAR